MKILLACLALSFGFAVPAVADRAADYGPDWTVCKSIKQDPQAAIEACNRLFAGGKLTQPDLALVYNHRGVAWFYLNRLDLAALDYAKGQQADPTNPELHTNLGLVYFQTGRYGDALVEYDKVVALAPEDPGIYCKRAKVLTALNRGEEAVKSYLQELKNNPDDLCALESLGTIFRTTRRYEEALVVLDRAVAVSGGDAASLDERGYTYQAMEQNERALADFTSAVAVNPRDFYSLLSRGVLYGETGQFNLAMIDLNNAVALAPDHAESYLRRGRVDFLRGDYQSALDDSKQCLALQPDQAPCIEIELRGAMMLGKFDAAAGSATTLAATWHRDGYLLYRGAARFASDDLSTAQADFTFYTAAVPQDPYGWLWLYLANRALGKEDSTKLKELARRRDAWPTMIIRYMVGEASAADVMASVDVPDPAIKWMRTAEANYYLGQLAAMDGEAAKAAALFQACLDIGHAEVDMTKPIVVYKDDDDLELALANAALHGKGL
jgi:lipoprotein NlpI